MTDGYDYTQLTVQDRICFTWRYDHFYFLDRYKWGKENWDESRHRHHVPQDRDGRSDSDHVPCFWGWQMVEYHSLTNNDRLEMYLTVPDWWLRDYSAARVLAVPTPWILVYAQQLFRNANPNQLNELYYIARIEYSIFCTLCVVDASYNGLPRGCNGTSDYRVHGGGSGYTYTGRLFNLPQGVVSMLSVMHPFYILESSGYDPVLGFLALRRAQEVHISNNVCAQYDWNSGESVGFDEITVRTRVRRRQDGTEVWRTTVHDPVDVHTTVTGTTDVSVANAAWDRFKQLTEGHRGQCARTNVTGDVTRIMNMEGYGIESPGLTSRRQIRDSQSWQPQTLRYSSDTESRLNNFRTIVEAKAWEPFDGGLSEVIGQIHQKPSEQPAEENGQTLWARMEHPDGTVPRRADAGTSSRDRRDNRMSVSSGSSSDSPPRPTWWPPSETRMATKAMLDTFSAVCLDNGRSAPDTLGTALTTATDLCRILASNESDRPRTETDAEITRLQEQLRASQLQVSTQRRQLTTFRNNEGLLRKQMTAQDQQLTDSVAAADAARESAAQSEVIAQRVPELEASLQTCRTEITNLRRQSTEATTRYNTVTADMTAVVNQQGTRLSTLVQQQEEIRRATDESLAAYETPDGEDQRTRRTRRNGVLDRIRTLTTQLLDSHRADLDRMTELLANSRNTLSNDATTATDAQMLQLQQQLDQVRTECDTAKKERDEDRVRLVSLEQQLEDTKRDLEARAAELTTMRTDFSSAQREAVTQRDRADRLFQTATDVVGTADTRHREWSNEQKAAIRAANTGPRPSEGGPS